MIRGSEDFDKILDSLDDELEAYDNHITPDNYAEENQSYAHSGSHMNAHNLPNVTGQDANQTLLRSRMRNAKEAAAGIENIINEMPSRTLGRRGGAQVKDAIHFGTVSRNTVSRRFGQNTFKRRQSTFEEILQNETNVAKEIYREMKDKDGEVDYDDLRQLDMNMNVKKQIRNQAIANRQQKKNRNVGCFKIWKYKMSMKWRHFKESTKKALGSAKLWNYHLKQVEGNFGSGVVSYFTFLRGLFILSIPAFVLNFAFISIPQIIEPEPRTNPNITFTGEEILTGANWLTETIMYYGYYTNQPIQAISGAYYDMQLAYLLATAGYFVLCLILLIKTTATNFRKSFIDNQENRSSFISKVFCSWDYGITSTTAAKLQHKTITTELKEILSERQMAIQRRSLSEKLEVYAFRFVTWAVVLGIIAGCMTLIYYLQSIFLAQIRCTLSDVKVLPEIALALIVSTINLIMPIIFNAITLFEKYKYPRHQLYIAVFRNFLLKIGMLAVICTFWTAGDVITTNSNSSNCPGNTLGDCWETALGQEAYRLVIIDFLFSIVFSTFCAEFLRRIFATYCCKTLTRPEFSIVNNVMDLIYGQTLCWIGVFFSPLLPLIVILKYFIMFYVKKVSVMQNCVPPTKRWRAAQTRTLFNFLLLLSFLLSAVFLCVVVFRLTPSTTCGPYRGLDHAYDVIVIGINDLAGNQTTAWLADILTAVGSVWVLNAIVTALAVAVAINFSKSKGYNALSKALQEQIKLEGKDKALILQWLQNVVKQSDTFTGPGSPGFSGKPEHVVPILSRHRDSVHSSHSSRTGSIRGVHPQTPLSASNVLTYVDPQHVLSGALANKMYRSDSVSSRSAHKDPLLRKALQKQQQAPPSSTTENSHIPEPDYMKYETTQLDDSVVDQWPPRPDNTKISNSASSSPMVQRRQIETADVYSQPRPSSMFVTSNSSKYGFETSSLEDDDDDGYNIPAWKQANQAGKQNQNSENIQMQNVESPQSAYHGYAEPDYD